MSLLPPGLEKAAIPWESHGRPEFSFHLFDEKGLLMRKAWATVSDLCVVAVVFQENAMKVQ